MEHFRWHRGPVAAAALASTLTLLISVAPPAPPAAAAKRTASTAEELLVVDCLLPGKIRRLGRRHTYLTPHRPMRTTALDCQIRGGEYTESDRANYRTALQVWLTEAKAGDPEAQYYVGQIYEKGLGLSPDYEAAAHWYRQAAEQGYSAAQISLGYFYETGLGVAADPAEALNWYRTAAGLPDELIVLESSAYEELLELNNKFQRQSEEVERLQRQLEELQRKLGDAEGERERGGARERELRRQIAELEGQIEAGQDLIGSFRQRIAGMEAQIATAEEVAPAANPVQAVQGIPSDDFGPFVAVVIGNRNYQRLRPVAEAIERATAMASLLEERYAFQVRRLFDATRYDILSALNELRQELTERHNLLIYYFGHSASDPETQRSWWQPVDAEPDSRANWISTRVMSDHLDLIPAKHVLVIADAAFAGVLTRSAVPRLPQGMTDSRRLDYIREMLERRARLVLSSNAAEAPPSDATFSQTLLQILQENRQIIEASEVHRQLSSRMAAAAGPAVRRSIPVFAPIRWARSEGGGDFFFVPR